MFVRSTQGGFGPCEANSRERSSKFAITEPEWRYQHPQTGAVVMQYGEGAETQIAWPRAMPAAESVIALPEGYVFARWNQ